MIDVPSGIFQCRSNVFVLQIGEIVKDFRAARSAGQKIQDIRDTDTLAANARSPAENLRIGGDAIKIAHRYTVGLASSRCDPSMNWKSPQNGGIALWFTPSAAEAAR